MWRKFWNDESGAIISAELAMVMTVVVVSMVAGLSSLRDSVTGELADVGQAFSDMDQSIAVGGINSPSAAVSGFTFVDDRDFADEQGIAGQNNRGLAIRTPMLPLTRDNSFAGPRTSNDLPVSTLGDSGWQFVSEQ